jgi:hypothetical protein
MPGVLSAQEGFSKPTVLQVLNKLQRTEIIQTMFSDHDRIKFKISNKRTPRKSPNLQVKEKNKMEMRKYFELCDN